MCIASGWRRPCNLRPISLPWCQFAELTIGFMLTQQQADNEAP
jgi:hypothetical protein